MKQKKILVFMITCLLVFSNLVFAAEKESPSALFMGTVQEVQKDEKNNVLMVRAKGYIKGCEIYAEEIIAVIGEDTILVPEGAGAKGEDLKFEKVNLKEFKIKKGDVVFILLSDAMTKSIPPQVVAKAIQIANTEIKN